MYGQISKDIATKTKNMVDNTVVARSDEYVKVKLLNVTYLPKNVQEAYTQELEHKHTIELVQKRKIDIPHL